MVCRKPCSFSYIMLDEPPSSPPFPCSSWSETRINKVSLPEALRCWEVSTMREQGSASRRKSVQVPTPFPHPHPNSPLVLPPKEDPIASDRPFLAPSSAATSFLVPSTTEISVELVPLLLMPSSFSSSSSSAPLSAISSSLESSHPHPVSTSDPNSASSLLLDSNLAASGIEGEDGGASPIRRHHTHVKLIEERGAKRRKRKRKHRQRQHHLGMNTAPSSISASSSLASASFSSSPLSSSPSLHTGPKLRNHPIHRSNQVNPPLLPSGPGCSFRHVDICSWPQCNRECPRLFNPLTGKEMDFIELFKTLGLNMAEVADAMGIDKSALNQMDHESLLQMLTQ